MDRIILMTLITWPLITHAQKPTLGLPYGHTDVVHNILFSPDGSLLLSGGEDESIKLWDVKTGKLLKTSDKLNGAVLPGAAASADMRYMRYGRGWTDGREWIFDFSRPNHIGTPIEDWKGPSLPVKAGTHLPADQVDRFEVPDGHYLEDVTPDGKYLLLTSYTGRVKLFDPVKKDTVLVYNLPLDRQESYLFDRTADSKISPDGQLIARGRGDGTIYLQDLRTGRLVRTLRAHNWPPAFLQFGQDNTTLLCGTQEGTARIWDFTKSMVSASAGSRTYEYLYANSFRPVGDREVVFYPRGGPLARYDLAGRQNEVLLQFPPGNYDDLIAYHPGTQLAYFSGYDEILGPVTKTYDLSQSPPVIQQLPAADLKGISPDGSLGVSFELTDGQFKPRLLGLPGLEPIKELAPAKASYMSPAKAIFSADQQKVLMLTDYSLQDGTTSYVWDIPSGRLEHALDEPGGSYATCGTLSSDGKFLLLGTWSHAVHYYDLSSGQLLHTFKGHTGRINSVAFSPDGKKMASGAEDGAVKIWDLAGRKEIATLVNIDQDDWIVLGPGGLFDASQNAMNLMYYTVETNGRQEIIELEQLKARYYEPGLLQKLAGLSNERIRQVDGLDQVALYPEVSASIENDQLRVQLKARSGGIGGVSIFVNGKEVANDANPKRAGSIAYDLKQTHGYLFRHPDSTNILSLRAYNQAGWLKSPSVDLVYRPVSWAKGSSNSSAEEWQGQLDPKMYVLAIGTSDYTGTQMDLKYATQDATVMARALQSVGGNLFANGDSIEVYCLTTAAADSTGLEGTPVKWQYASKENVRATLETIRKKAKAEDVLLVYLSGHGLTYGGAEQSQFYYLTSSIASEEMIGDADLRSKYTISSGELTEWLNNIAALKQVLILDACNSGKVVETLTGGARNLNSSQIRALDRMKDRTGMFILSGSAADKVSYEASEYGQGLLTYSLLQGMLGVATRKTADGDFVDVMKLFQYARDEVPRLAATINGIQTPMLGFPTKGASFDIGILNERVNIPLSRKKPVMVRSNFLNQATLKDDLGLVKLLETAFLEETEKGKDADLIYVDVTDYPGAYSLSGLYTKAGENINITVKLFEGGQSPIDLTIPATDDAKRLARYIVREVKQVLADRR